MKIHGIRIYPQSTKVTQGGGARIYVHERVREGCTDFYFIFRQLAPLWGGCYFANDFTVTYDEKMRAEDPMPGLRNKFGDSLVAADLESQILLLKGEDFERWGPSMSFCEGALLPVFRESPSFALLKRLYWGRDFRLTSETWPNQMCAVLHMWDDLYWQLFTRERSDIELLMRAHNGDPMLKMYYVDFDREYPDPSNDELQIVEFSDGTRTA